MMSGQMCIYQSKDDAYHKSEGTHPLRDDDNWQNIGDEKLDVELGGVRHEAGGLSLIRLYCNLRRERARCAGALGLF